MRGKPAVVLIVLLVAGSALRFNGIDRGRNDPSSSEGTASSFYHFHPDENLVVDAALAPYTPTQPPFTVYGMLPSYLLRAALEWFGTPGVESPSSEEFQVFRVARLLAALYSCGVLVAVWLLAKTCCGYRAAAIALVLVGFAPGVIQQSQFYIVDGLFVLLSTISMLLILSSLRQPSLWRYALTGLMIGLTASVRLNGALLGFILVLGWFLRDGALPGEKREIPSAWWLLCVSGFSALASLLIVQPNLAVNPGALIAASGTPDFGLSVKVVRGELLQPWTLVDVHTTPFLYHWTDLFPTAVGWPATIAFLAGIACAIWRRSTPTLLILSWCAVHFLVVGGFQAKSVRYVIPMVPFLAVLAGNFLSIASARSLGSVLGVVVVGHVALYGLAVARLYTMEDSRVEAARWLRNYAARNASVGVERGGFSMGTLVADQGFRVRGLNISRIFYAAPYSLCSERVRHIETRLKLVDYLAIVDANRYAQFTAAPDLFPVVSNFYRQLTAEQLGFKRVAVFKNHPQVFGIRWNEENAEPSFVGYDHPAVWIFERETTVGRKLQRWAASLADRAECPDRNLRDIAENIELERPRRALDIVDETVKRFPHDRLAHLLAWKAQTQMGNDTLAARSLRKYHSGVARDRMAHTISSGTLHFVPGATAMSLIALGSDQLAADVLRRGVSNAERLSTGAAADMAASYGQVAQRFFDDKNLELMEETLLMSLIIHPTEFALKILTLRSANPSALDAALGRWDRSRSLGNRAPEIHRLIGRALEGQPELTDRAQYHVRRATLLDATMDEKIWEP
jgi:hypothetical protein